MAPETTVHIDPERQEKAREYARRRYALLAVELCLGGAYLLAWLVSGAHFRLRELLWAFSPHFYLVVALYFLLLASLYRILTFPLSYYGGYVLPHRYGLSVQSLKGWLADQLKGTLVGLGLGLVMIEVVYWFLDAFPGFWWLLAGAFYLLFAVVLANLAPVLLVPLFFRFKPLEDEELAGRLKTLAERAGTRVRGVFTLELSAKTTAANAALMGLGNTRRIVLGDTLLDKYTPDEIEVLLAHELGHHVHRDIGWGILAQSAFTLAGLYLAHRALQWAIGFFGFQGMSDVAAMPFLALTVGCFSLLVMPFSNAYFRWRETLADDYALKMTARPEAFASALAKLADQNLAQLEPPRWAELLLHDHPPVGKRIQRAERWKTTGST